MSAFTQLSGLSLLTTTFMYGNHFSLNVSDDNGIIDRVFYMSTSLISGEK